MYSLIHVNTNGESESALPPSRCRRAGGGRGWQSSRSTRPAPTWLPPVLREPERAGVVNVTAAGLPWAGLLAEPVNPSRPVNFGIRKSESVGHHGPKPALQLQIRSSFKFWMWPRAGTDSPDYSPNLRLNVTGGPPAPQPFKLPGEATVGKKET